MYCKDTQAELAERVAAIDVAVGPDRSDQNGEDNTEGKTPVFSDNIKDVQRNGVNSDVGMNEFLASQQTEDAHWRHVPKRPLIRPVLSSRKLSLQERSSGGYLASSNTPGYGPYATGPSPRIMRRPTIESNRVSISDSEVGMFSPIIVVSRQCKSFLSSNGSLQSFGAVDVKALFFLRGKKKKSLKPGIALAWNG